MPIFSTATTGATFNIQGTRNTEKLIVSDKGNHPPDVSVLQKIQRCTDKCMQNKFMQNPAMRLFATFLIIAGLTTCAMGAPVLGVVIALVGLILFTAATFASARQCNPEGRRLYIAQCFGILIFTIGAAALPIGAALAP